MKTATTHARAGVQKGMTLLELVITLAITGILTVAIGSSIVIATHAIPSAGDSMTARISAGQTVEDLAGELQEALTITTADDRRIEYTVPDRNADGDPETIRYEWSGTAGDPLTRRYNGGTTRDVLDNVQEFELTYLNKPEPWETEVVSIAIMLNTTPRSQTRVRSRALTLNYPVK